MEKAPFINLKVVSLVKGRILTVVFRNNTDKIKINDVFSKFFAAGFEVMQLGINVKPSQFILLMKRFSPHVLIFLCQDNRDDIKELVEAIKKEGMRSRVRIILYDPEINESVRDEVHADACTDSEQELFDMVNEIMNKPLS